MPTLTIDGNEVEFKNGQTVIEAAKDAGIEIPHFCWHPKLSVSGNCRVCLVEIEKMPKLVIACSTMAAEGMVVHTQSDKTVKARNAVMEFILINHPLDCPICDEAGECKLQDYAFNHGVGESRFVEEKQHKDKRIKLGPRIMFDGERCISCSRCIRFSDEIAGENQLTFVKRGDRVTITTFPGEEFDNPYTLNTVDICPVGALTSTDFRFQSRVWELSSTKSVCIGCSRGCNTEIWSRNNKILRLTPRQNEEVNQEWMCDHGRLDTFKFLNADTRVENVSVRREGVLNTIDWNEGFELTVKRLKEYKSGEIAFFGSPVATVEDNYVFAQFAKSMGVKNLVFAPRIKIGSGDKILITEDKSPNAKGAELTGFSAKKFDEVMDGINFRKIKAAFILEDDIASLREDYKEALSRLELLVVTSTNYNELTEMADIIFPASTYAEKNGTFVNVNNRLQRIRPAIAAEDMDRALDGMAMSRWDKFGTRFDRWQQGKKYPSKPSWKIISELAEKVNLHLRYDMAETVFEEAASKIKELKGLNYDDIGELGITLTVVKQKTTEEV